MSDPLATDDQRATETLALRLLERPDVRAAREKARAILLADPVAKTFDGRLGLDRALDQWATALCMREANGDPNRPKVVWNIDNSPRNWFGHAYPGGAVAVDNPDNINREIPIDADGHYEVDIRFSDDPASLSLVLELEPKLHAGIGEYVASLTAIDLDPQPGKTLKVSVGPEATGAGQMHLQTRPGRLQLYSRDSHSDWAQRPATITVRRLDAAQRPERTEDEVAAVVVEAMAPFVGAWNAFKDTFLGPPEPNRLVGPQGRIGGWGFLAGGRFALTQDEALLVTISRGGAAYTGFQISDCWTMAPDPVWRTTSCNKDQSVPNPDGSVSFVIATVDPGVANWIDTAGLAAGWMMLRWQGAPSDTDPASLIREVRLISPDAIPAEIPRIDLAGRRQQILERARLHHHRTEAGR